MLKAFPAAAGAFESSSGIPFLSLPNMGGIVRKREEECGSAVEAPYVMSEGTVSLTLPGNSQEGMSGILASRLCYSLRHVCKIFVVAAAHTRLLLCYPHTHIQSCSTFPQSSHLGDISSRKVLFPSLTPRYAPSQHRVLCVRPPDRCGVFTLPV
ncbi:hypothetical protein AMECASPLE_035675 [Ameca splendens]|uniref:Uncharacterized protein n=1 Tax=Ameca splendens TaxID=208324 RepID=A0ABV0XWC5_9TELE